MSQRTNRTFICSVLFLDIVEYSRMPVEEQIQLKERFNALLSEAIQDIAVNDRIILDTGDGAAISFLGDPEDALFVAMEFRDSVMNRQADAPPQLSIRMGINLGPVKLITDINKQLNLIGDGINVAQRVMNFAQPGQLLVSRSYYEVISCLSQEYAKLFNYQGSHSDKHVREHEVYAVGYHEMRQKPLSNIPVKQQNIVVSTDAALAGDQPQSDQTRSIRTETSAPVDPLRTPGARIQRFVNRKWLYASIPLAIAAIVIITLSLPGIKNPSESHSTPVKVIAVPQAKTATTPLAGSNKKGLQTAQSAAPSESAAGQLSSIQFRVLPWGEIYVNGKKKGVSPPLTSVRIKPGKYKIEIKNSSFAVYTESVELKSNDKIQVNHTFR